MFETVTHVNAVEQQLSAVLSKFFSKRQFQKQGVICQEWRMYEISPHLS